MYYDSMQERLQKILSVRGICSRRKAEEYIEQGLVKVNGVVVSIGDKADPEIDMIEVDGQVLNDRQNMLYYLMNKPVGVVTSNRVTSSELLVPSSVSHSKPVTSNQTTVRDILPKNLQGKIYPVGRLDKDTSGLLLFTNDGVLAYRLTHPKYYHEKEYEVVTQEPITDGQLRKMKEGMMILGSKTKPAVVKRMNTNTFTIALTEGKNRQIRRMCQKVGSPVKDLKRIRITSLQDSSLKAGELRELTQSERDQLLTSLDLST